jgi:PPK2 family polyphosphate:nucleotide phosphotransferase
MARMAPKKATAKAAKGTARTVKKTSAKTSAKASASKAAKPAGKKATKATKSSAGTAKATKASPARARKASSGASGTATKARKASSGASGTAGTRKAAAKRQTSSTTTASRVRQVPVPVPVPTGKLLDKLRVPAGPVDLSSYDPAGTPGLSGGKTKGKKALAKLGPALSDWQERLYAEGRTGGSRRILLVLQGMDTSGKGGTIRHGAGMMDPQGLRLTTFKAPTPAERRRGFLWRIRQALPAPGYIGVYDRSHYEDVLIARVRNLVPESVWSRRYAQINEFEQEVAAGGTTILKCYLHISAEEQKQRLLARLDNPAKHWKYHPHDVDERMLWPAYMQAYEAALERCNDPIAPWYVIPSDRKWYRNWAVTTLLEETLRGLNPQWPEGDFDVAAERKRVLET